MKLHGPSSLATRLFALLFSAVFALAFGGVGIGFGLLPLSRTLQAAWQVRSWQAVPAQVVSSELDVVHDSEGTTHRVRARYRYQWNGQTFESARVGLDDRPMADNLGDWHEAWHRRLDAARASGQAITARVNPQQPSQALLDPAIRWPWLVFHLPFAFVFTGVGLGAGWIFLRVLRGDHLREPVDEPGRSSASRKQRPLWFFALFWCGIAFPLATVFWLGNAPWWVKAFVSVFVLVGIGLLRMAIRQTALAWRYAGSVPLWRPSPPRAGQALAVTLNLTARAVRDVDPSLRRLRLAQYRVDDAGSGETERLVEHFDALVTALPDPQGGERWDARFDLPADAPTHRGRRSGERVEWRLQVLDGQGHDVVSFDVPVQADSAALRDGGGVPDRFDPRARLNREEAIAPAAARDTPSQAVEAEDLRLPASVRTVETPDAFELHFSQTGSRWLAVVSLATAVLLIGVWRNAFTMAWGWAALGAWRWWLVACLLGIGLHALSRRRSLAVRDDGLLVRVESWMGRTCHHLAPTALDHLFHKVRYTQTSSGGAEREFHAVHAREHAGGPDLRLTPALPGAAAAVAVARTLLAARQHRAGRFAPGAFRQPQRTGWRPGPGWLLWALLLVGLAVLPH